MEGSHVHKDILYVCVSVGVKPLRHVGPAPLQGGAVASRWGCYALIFALLRMPVTCLAIARQECRTSYKFMPCGAV